MSELPVSLLFPEVVLEKTLERGGVLHDLSFKHAGKINDFAQVADFPWDGTEGRMGWGSRGHLWEQTVASPCQMYM